MDARHTTGRPRQTNPRHENRTHQLPALHSNTRIRRTNTHPSQGMLTHPRPRTRHQSRHMPQHRLQHAADSRRDGNHGQMPRMQKHVEHQLPPEHHEPENTRIGLHGHHAPDHQPTRTIHRTNRQREHVQKLGAPQPAKTSGRNPRPPHIPHRRRIPAPAPAPTSRTDNRQHLAAALQTESRIMARIIIEDAGHTITYENVSNIQDRQDRSATTTNIFHNTSERTLHTLTFLTPTANSIL